MSNTAHTPATAASARIFAFCFQEGDIDTGPSVPDGAISICSGEPQDINRFLSRHCEKGIFNGRCKPMIMDVNIAFNYYGAGADETVDALTDWIEKAHTDHQFNSLNFSV